MTPLFPFLIGVQPIPRKDDIGRSGDILVSEYPDPVIIHLLSFCTFVFFCNTIPIGIPEVKADMKNTHFSYPFLQILSGDDVLEWIRKHRLPEYHYLLDEFIWRSPEEIQEWQFLQKMEKGTGINIKSVFENLITNILMAMYSTGTFIWMDKNSGKMFFLKSNMPSGIVYRLNYCIRKGCFGREEKQHLLHYLRDPRSYEFLRDRECDHPDDPTGSNGEDHYLLHLSIVPYGTVNRKFSSFTEKHHYSNDIHFTEDYLSFFTKTIGEFVISDPSVISRTDFHNFMDSFAFSLNLKEMEYMDEWYTLKNLDSGSKKFLVNVLITDFLHNTGFWNELCLDNPGKFVQENIKTIEEVSNIILNYVWKTIYRVFINERRFFVCAEYRRVAEFMEKSLEISRYPVINWNGNEKKLYLPLNGTNWDENERTDLIPSEISGNEIEEMRETRDQILREYRDEAEYLVTLMERIWREC